MKITAYIRVSTQAQSYDRQEYTLKQHFTNHGMSLDDIDFVEEKITSHTSFKERAVFTVLNNAQPGDKIYTCQVDRLGRTVEDIISLAKFADSKGVEIYALKEQQTITYTTYTGKMYLTLMAMVAEMERELRAERCQAGLEAAKEEIRRNGFRIARVSGKIQTRWGNEKGYDMSKAVAASSVVLTAKKVAWRENSPAFQWVVSKIKEGWPRKTIIEEFNKLHEIQPEVFCSPRGSKLSPGLLSYWIRDAGLK